MNNESSTATDSLNSILVYTPEIADRLDSWVESQQTCWVIAATQSGALVEVHGRLCRSSINGQPSYRLNDDKFLSNVNFLLQAVESVGNACVFLKP